ncbi:spore germination protein GerPB [Pseudalkalibacillus berkeleyi]|uniref:Spore germination protein GerPB n=1 Tax=Pseudalkalibacillus berkeleyi TaxID=1069813 RepID=A0ABS9GZW8_9BACL|nr:spore germination protein GerPB [Pseudalkalibacillus berkeleyi]MCF6137371.1 spore germination protein GerPB [Pseudalkalibacillus berkeleyi]
MNVYVNQTISIQTIRIDGLSNSSVLQIGTSGVIKPVSYLGNTGEFVGPAPAIENPFGSIVETSFEGPLVPLSGPRKD